MGLAAKDFAQKFKFRSKEKEDKSKLYCTHCKMKKHTKETCFRLVGYPEWWEDGHKEKNNQHSRSDVKGAPAANGGEDSPEKGQGQSTGFGGMAAKPGEKLGGHSYEGYHSTWY
ncbi:hypothetical protein HanIR_Chr17g0898571 [Helianthus annuus]|nr:hypothetical protein HanIR_Chr17g0898571 [Helianthus annuus]